MDNLSLPEHLIFGAPESEMLTAGPRLSLRNDSDTNVVVRAQSFLEPNRKRQIECVGQPGEDFFRFKKPRAFKRPRNAVRETPGFACPLYKHDPSRFGGPRGCADWCTLEIRRLYSDHLKKHVNQGDISNEMLDAVKKLKPDIRDSTPEAKAAERWSLTYRYLHKLYFSEDKIPSPYYQRPEASFERPSQHFTTRPERSESLRHEPEQLDFISHPLSMPLAHEVASPSNRSPSRPQPVPDLEAKHPSSMQAGKRGVEAVASSLLNQDLTIDVRDKNGRTALMRVVRHGDQGTARLLLELGAAVNAQDEDGWTALGFAALIGDVTMTELLLEWGASVNAQDRNAETPLHIAATLGYDAAVKLLLARNDINPNIKDTYGQTPLWSAAEDGHEEVVKLLLAREDIDLNSRDMVGQTPLLVALSKGHKAVAELLRAKGGVL